MLGCANKWSSVTFSNETELYKSPFWINSPVSLYIKKNQPRKRLWWRMTSCAIQDLARTVCLFNDLILSNSISLLSESLYSITLKTRLIKLNALELCLDDCLLIDLHLWWIQHLHGLELYFNLSMINAFIMLTGYGGISTEVKENLPEATGEHRDQCKNSHWFSSIHLVV